MRYKLRASTRCGVLFKSLELSIVGETCNGGGLESQTRGVALRYVESFELIEHDATQTANNNVTLKVEERTSSTLMAVDNDTWGYRDSKTVGREQTFLERHLWAPGKGRSDGGKAREEKSAEGLDDAGSTAERIEQRDATRLW